MKRIEAIFALAIFCTGIPASQGADNLREYSPDAYVLAAAQASDLVYDLAENADLKLVTHQRIGEFVLNTPDGFRGALYEDRNGTYYLAFAGTDPTEVQDALVDLVVGGVPTEHQTARATYAESQVRAALNFSQSAKAWLCPRTFSNRIFQALNFVHTALAGLWGSLRGRRWGAACLRSGSGGSKWCARS